MELNSDERQLIEQVAKENGFTKFEIIANPGSGRGDNFLGIITSVEIKSETRSLYLILKTASTNEALRKVQPTRKIFLREIYLYQKVFTEFELYQEEHNIPNRFNAYAKLYGANLKENGESIAMEDLRAAGYSMCNKKLTMNVDHIKAILTEYAKWHSVSLVMNKKSPDRFKKLIKDLKDDIFNMDVTEENAAFMDKYIEGVTNNALKVVEGDIKATESLKKFGKEAANFLKYDANSENNMVITHGDSWCNNFLFTYEESKSTKPSSVRIVDWQLSKFGSPGYDLANFLFANSSEEILKDFKIYLHYYHDVVAQNIRDFGCDPEEIYPYDLVENSFRKQTKNALWINIQVFRMTLCEAQESPNFEELAKEEADITDFTDFAVGNMDLYNQRISCLINFMLENECF